MNDENPAVGQFVMGRVKWFDPVKGFGFLSDPEGGSDVLLHGNVLRSFGQSSIVEGAIVEVRAIATARGRQAAEVLSVAPPAADPTPPIAELEALGDTDIEALPLLPARVKWFDRNKGFGFANVFGRRGDVFLHVEVLRRCGFADLIAGEAVCLRIFTAQRGMIAAQVAAWEKAVTEGAILPDCPEGSEPCPVGETRAEASLLERMRTISKPTARPTLSLRDKQPR